MKSVLLIIFKIFLFCFISWRAESFQDDSFLHPFPLQNEGNASNEKIRKRNKILVQSFFEENLEYFLISVLKRNLSSIINIYPNFLGFIEIKRIFNVTSFSIQDCSEQSKNVINAVEVRFESHQELFVGSKLIETCSISFNPESLFQFIITSDRTFLFINQNILSEVVYFLLSRSIISLESRMQLELIKATEDLITQRSSEDFENTKILLQEKREEDFDSGAILISSTLIGALLGELLFKKFGSAIVGALFGSMW